MLCNRLRRSKMFFKDTNNLITRCVNYEMDDIKYTSNKESGI